MANAVQPQIPFARNITQEKLREIFTYDEGVFRYRVTRGNVLVGTIAGALHSQGWRRIKISRQSYQAHHLVWLWFNGAWPNHELDHLNGIRDDNRISNLREADKFQQVANSARPTTNKTGVKNVYLDKERNLYRVAFRHHGRKLNFGRFNTLEEATLVADNARKCLLGEFASYR